MTRNINTPNENELTTQEEDMLFWESLLINDTTEYDMIDQLGW